MKIVTHREFTRNFRYLKRDILDSFGFYDFGLNFHLIQSQVDSFVSLVLDVEQGLGRYGFNDYKYELLDNHGGLNWVRDNETFFRI